MKTVATRRLGLIAPTLAAVLVTGCATPTKPLYYWGNYQPEVYAYYKKQESPQAQLGKLDETVQKAASSGLPLPPGFHAHLGLLHLQEGDLAKGQQEFLAEAAQFPESKPYMDFLLKNKSAAKAAAPVAPVKALPPKTPAPKAAPLKKTSTTK